MFEIKTLKDGLKKIAPRTKTSAVTDNNNKNLDTILSEKANSADVPSKVSQLTNDTGFITNAALANYPNNTQMNDAINSHHDSTKQDKLAAQTPYTNVGSKNKIPKITTNALGQVTNVEEVDVEAQQANLSQNLTYANDNNTSIVTNVSDDLLLSDGTTYIEAKKSTDVINNGLLSSVEKAIARFSKNYFSIKNTNEVSLDINKVLAKALLLDGSNILYNPVSNLNNFSTGVGLFHNGMNLPFTVTSLIISGSHQKNNALIQLALSYHGEMKYRVYDIDKKEWKEWNSLFIDNLSSRNNYRALSANQGRILNETKQDKLTFTSTDFNVTNNKVSLNPSKFDGYLLKSDAPGYEDILTNANANTTYETKANASATYPTKTEMTNALNKESEERAKADTALQNEIDELNRLIDYHVYGFKREIANSNYLTRITYTDEARGKTPVTVNLTNQTQDLGSWGDFINKVARPVMVTYGGVVDYELDHNDTTKKLDGSPSDIDNLEYKGNAMVEFRNYRYVSRKTVDGFQYVRFANYKVDDTFEDNAFINDNGAHSLAFYFSMFDGGLVNDKMRSIAGAEILRSKNASQEMTLAKSNGQGWNTGTWSQLNYIWDLLTLLGKTDGFQETFGRGICDLSHNDGVNPFGWIVGQTKNKGCFFGQSGGANPVRTLWIEDLWGRSHDRYTGLINDNGTFKVKLVPPYPMPSDSAGAYSDYIDTGLVTPAEGYVKEANCSEFGFLPQAVGGSASTYFCDSFYKNDVGVKYVLVGGFWIYGSSCGRYVHMGNDSSFANAGVGSRLSYNA